MPWPAAYLVCGPGQVTVLLKASGPTLDIEPINLRMFLLFEEPPRGQIVGGPSVGSVASPSVSLSACVFPSVKQGELCSPSRQGAKGRGPRALRTSSH